MVFASSFFVDTSEARPMFLKDRGAANSSPDDGDSQEGTSAAEVRSGNEEKGPLRRQDLRRTWPGLNFRMERLAHPAFAQKRCKRVETGGGHLKRIGHEETKESKEERGQEAAAARLPVRGEIDGMPRETQVWAIGGVTGF
jgi:hypothetical protein